VLDLAQRLGIEETEADAIITSVYNVNNTFLAIIGVLALGFILFVTRSVIVPFVIALFLAMIINKVEGLVTRALHWHRFRWINQLAAMVLIMTALFGLLLAGFVSGKDIATRFPFYQDKLVAGVNEVQRAAAARGIDWLEGAGLTEQLSQLPIASTVGGFVSSLLSFLGNFFLVMVFTGFMVFSITRFDGVLQEMNEKISAYISIKTMVSALTGTGVYLICLAFGVDFALFWAIFAFLLNFIPSVGSIIATIPPILLAAVQLASPGTVVVFGALMIGLQMGIGNVLEPRLMGSKLAVKPLAILLGLIFWGFLWGIPGMFLAAPLMALMRVLTSYFNFSRSVEQLLAAD
jgi:AI-2 transport protein TqsA